MDFPGSGAGDTLQHCSATSGMRVAPMEEKANATQHLNGGVSGDWIILEKEYSLLQTLLEVEWEVSYNPTAPRQGCLQHQ